MANPLVERLGWVLVHFVWQGTAVALLLGLSLFLTRRKSANARYGLACFALLTLASCPIATFVLLKPTKALQPISQQVKIPPVSVHSLAVGPVGTAVTIPSQSSFDLQSYLPGLVFVWGLGVGLLTLRLIGGFLQVERLKRKHTSAAPPDWQARIDAMAVALGIRFKVTLLESDRLEIPAAMGVLRAIVILPCSLITRLSPQEIEALLIHELAHVRRHDYLVNLIQTVIETALFYHPSVWWVSRVVRTEREHCCDDIAAKAAASPVVYARALASLEELRGAFPRLSMSAKRGFLMNRINRVLGLAKPSIRTSHVWPSVALIAGLVVVFGTAIESYSQVNPPAKKSTASKVHAKSKNPVAKKATSTGIPTLSANGIRMARNSGPQKVTNVKTPVHVEPIAKVANASVSPAVKAAYKVADATSTAIPTLTRTYVSTGLKASIKAAATSTSIPTLAKTRDTTSKDGLVNADLPGVEFNAAVQTIASQTGASYVISSSNLRKVSAKFVNTTQTDAFNAICYASGVVWKHRANIIYFERRDEQDESITDLVTVHLKNVNLRTAANEIARLLGAKIDVELYEPESRSDIDLEGATLPEAVEYLSRRYRVRHTPRNGGWVLTMG